MKLKRILIAIAAVLAVVLPFAAFGCAGTKEGNIATAPSYFYDFVKKDAAGNAVEQDGGFAPDADAAGVPTGWSLYTSDLERKSADNVYAVQQGGDEFNYFRFVHVGYFRSAIYRTVPVQQNTTYEFSFLYRIGDAAINGTGLNAAVLEDAEFVPYAVVASTKPTTSGASEWKSYTATFRAGAGVDAFTIAVRLGSPLAGGSLSVTATACSTGNTSGAAAHVDVRNVTLKPVRPAAAKTTVHDIAAGGGNLLQNGDFTAYEGAYPKIEGDANALVPAYPNAENPGEGWTFASPAAAEPAESAVRASLEFGHWKYNTTTYYIHQNYAKLTLSGTTVKLSQPVTLKKNAKYRISFDYVIVNPANGGVATGQYLSVDDDTYGSIGLHAGFADDSLYTGNAITRSTQTSTAQPWARYTAYVENKGIGKTEFFIRVGTEDVPVSGMLWVTNIRLEEITANLDAEIVTALSASTNAATNAAAVDAYRGSFVQIYGYNAQTGVWGSSRLLGALCIAAFAVLFLALVALAVLLLLGVKRERKAKPVFDYTLPEADGAAAASAPAEDAADIAAERQEELYVAAEEANLFDGASIRTEVSPAPSEDAAVAEETGESVAVAEDAGEPAAEAAAESASAAPETAEPAPGEASAAPNAKRPRKPLSAAVRTGLLVGACLLAGFLLRLVVVTLVEGYRADIYALVGLAAQLKAHGVGGFFDYFEGNPNTSGLMLYWLAVVGKSGAATDSVGYNLLLKLPLILADIGTAYLLFRLARKHWNVRFGFVVLALALLNPASWLLSAAWGHELALVACGITLTLYFLVNRQIEAFYLAFAVALLCGWQAALLAPAVLVFSVYLIVQGVGSLRKTARRKGKVGLAMLWGRPAAEIYRVPVMLVASFLLFFFLSLPLTLSHASDNIFYGVRQLVCQPLWWQTTEVLNGFNVFRFTLQNRVIYNGEPVTMVPAIIVLVLVLGLSVVFFPARKKRSTLILGFAFALALAYTFCFGVSPAMLVLLAPVLLLAFIDQKDVRLLHLFTLYSLLGILNVGGALAGAIHLNYLPDRFLDIVTNPYYAGAAPLAGNAFTVIGAALNLLILGYFAWVLSDLFADRTRPLLSAARVGNGNAVKGFFLPPAPEKK
ncbi:MAG: hypothetical protein LBM78_03695 [Clostridiales bacterium]|jgi:hypothetical protein|nr:hypothetical protein [Clostridiales bacterium]